MSKTYDYIIAGSGLAGLSLLYRLLKEPGFQHKEILVIDYDKKKQNDRTWCFWEKGEGPFQALVCHEWARLQFFSPQVSKEFKMREYRYKMIQSGDFYAHILNFVKSFSNICFVEEKIVEISEVGENASVKTEHNIYLAKYVFNSTGLFYPKMNEGNTLLQHFLGWFIQTEQPVFDPEVGTLMDFTLPQDHGTTFMYVLPTASNMALVEYTLFTERVLEEEEYEVALISYIRDKLGLNSYEIKHREFGIIPMSLAKFPSHLGKNKRIINIGTAGGYTKPSTGYTFQFVQKHIERLMTQMKQTGSPVVEPAFRERMFEWYDRTLVDVILNKRLSGEQIFSSLFKQVEPERILAFLANESGFWEEFRIRNSVPQFPFVYSGIKQLLGVGRP